MTVIEISDPSKLAQEISVHEHYLFCVANGLTKATKVKQRKHLSYVTELKSRLMEITSEGIESHESDEELLAALGIENLEDF
jgi:hypothetical protein